MTAFAMIIGMIPMALGLGEGAEQNAPLGRAVIGGLLFATVSTLFFVPLVFAGIHSRLARRHKNNGTDDGDRSGRHDDRNQGGPRNDGNAHDGNAGNGKEDKDGNGNNGPEPDHGGAGQPA